MTEIAFIGPADRWASAFDVRAAGLWPEVNLVLLDATGPATAPLAAVLRRRGEFAAAHDRAGEVSLSGGQVCH